MMSSTATVTKVGLVFLLVVSIIVVATAQAQAITCGQVEIALLPCLSYLKNGASVTAPCCDTVRSLNNAAKTTPERQLTCSCLKQAAKSFAINYAYADQLPSNCGIDLGIKISPSTDCSKVH